MITSNPPTIIPPLSIIELTQTCYACPSQWEGKLSDGRMIDIYYRSDHLNISLSRKATENLSEAIRGELIFSKKLDLSSKDGVLSLENLKKETSHILNYPG